MSLQLILAKETQECVGQKLGGSPVRPHVGAVQGARSALFVLLLITPGCGPLHELPSFYNHSRLSMWMIPHAQDKSQRTKSNTDSDFDKVIIDTAWFRQWPVRQGTHFRSKGQMSKASL